MLRRAIAGWMLGLGLAGLSALRSEAAEFSDVLRASALAVEVRGDRPEPYDFTGEVGTLRIDLERGVLEMAQVQLQGGKVVLSTRYFEIIEIERYPDSADFSCVDGLGFSWRGKVYYSKEMGQIFRVELIRRDSPRRIVNLGPRGKQFLIENKLEHFNLGI